MILSKRFAYIIYYYRTELRLFLCLMALLPCVYILLALTGLSCRCLTLEEQANSLSRRHFVVICQEDHYCKFVLGMSLLTVLIQ